MLQYDTNDSVCEETVPEDLCLGTRTKLVHSSKGTHYTQTLAHTHAHNFTHTHTRFLVSVYIYIHISFQLP